MALIPCSECKKEISDKAITCPQCGVPIPIEKESSFTLFFGRLIGARQAFCRKCRTPTNHSQYFCKTCGTYFPFPELNKTIFLFYFFFFIAWVLATSLPRTFGFLLS